MVVNDLVPSSLFVSSLFHHQLFSMPIPIACQCGRRFAAPDHLLGKRVACPGCGSAIDVAKPNRTAPQPSTAAKIPVRCQCGKAFGAAQRLAGKTVSCPACKQPLAVPTMTETPSGPMDATSTNVSVSKPRSLQISQPTAKNLEAINEVLDDVGVVQVGVQLCPGCNSELEPDAVMCVHCGYHVESGKTLKMKQYESTSASNYTASSPAVRLANQKNSSSLPRAVRLLSNGLIALGLFPALMWIAIYFVFTMIFGQQPDSSLTKMAVIFTIVSCVLSLPLFLAALLVRRGSEGGRMLTIGLAFLMLLNIPIGTLVAIFVLVQSFSADIVRYCGDSRK